MAWRYQPVWIKYKDTGITEFAVCEVFLTKDGKLTNWTECHAIAPFGNDLEDLRGSLADMLSECFKWKPVNFKKLRAGMTFQRL